MKTQSLNGEWQFRQVDSTEWLPAQVPGGVHTDLLALDLIPDPFVADNEKAVQWVAESDWEYQSQFTVESSLLLEEHIVLVCEGLDTLAEVIFNGTSLGHAENMFREYRWEVKPLIQPGENTILVKFNSPVEYTLPRQQEEPLIGGGDIPGGPYLRKAPSQWGWDWGPKLPPIGIWKDISLQGFTTARLDDVHLRQQHTPDLVIVQAAVAIERWRTANLKAILQIAAPDGQVQFTEDLLPDSTTKTDLALQLAHPELWWPAGYGNQPLYQVRVELYQGDQLLDSRSYQLGLRKIELRQQPDEYGKSFTFVVNGVQLFIKGADWIPADSFPTRLNTARLEDLIRSASMAHMNMLRVWGGGFYEDERFYDLCDRYGILIWQDFIFACGVYPHDPAFFENVRVEATQNVRRLRHRACLALWCGNNEMEQGWADWGWNRPEYIRYKAAYDRMFHHLLPGICETEDPDRPYWPSSASSNIPFHEPNSQKQGDVHYWDVWHGRKPFTAYRSQFPRFMSEFGFQALPPLETIRTYASESEWNMTSYVMEHHQRSGNGNGLMIAQMTDTFRMPKDFPSLVYLSMVLQAEGIRYGVEHWRRNKHRVGGTLYWQLNDCWPVASWSSLDYYGRWKALHYAARRFYAPVLLSLEEAGTQVAVHVTSDLLERWEGTLRWELVTIAGDVLDKGEQAVGIAPQASSKICTLNFDLTDQQRRSTVFHVELYGGENLIAHSLVTFAPNKHLALVKPGITVKTTFKDGRMVCNVSASSLARFVELSLRDADVVFDDNYFDLPAGKTIQVSCPLPEGWSVEQARQALSLRSLYDSF
jgi:beta-mannosidase